MLMRCDDDARMRVMRCHLVVVMKMIMMMMRGEDNMRLVAPGGA